MGSDTKLLIFTRAPVPGLAKTRLCPPLSPTQAAAVHEASLRDVVAMTLRSTADTELRYAESPAAADFFDRDFPHLRAAPQSGGDLGRRMASALDDAFGRGADRVLILGSDAPTLPDRALAEAVDRRGTVSLGPADDGGYYLVGLDRSMWPRARPMFRGIPWSTRAVLAVTRERLTRIGLRVELLRRWYDIDRIEDLRTAADHAAPGSHLADLLRRDEFARLVISSMPGTRSNA